MNEHAGMLPVGIYYMEILVVRLVRCAWRNFRHEFLMAGLSISSDNVVKIAEVWVFKNTIWYIMFTIIYIYMSRDETYSLQTSLDIREQVLTYVLFGRLNIQVKGMKWTNLTALLAKVLVCVHFL